MNQPLQDDLRAMNPNWSVPDIWGGLECTINRIGHNFFDQLQRANHYNRKDDIEMFAKLGIKAMRYPVLWEHHEPSFSADIDWSWITRQLNDLRNHHIEIVAGLVHHGSGPSFTSLTDAAFAEKLAGYARKVAQQFPWINYYTPVNEPLTTARFSGLYGLWYPHKKGARSFALMLLNQVKAVVLSMQAIREVTPHAKLVQTEDLGKTYSTPLLKYQADFENERRWLTYDLLCGKVNTAHPMWHYFTWLGINAETLNFFLEHPTPPDIIGVNHYLTSERYLDHEVENYPAHTHGGNSQHCYADIEAVRVTHNQPCGPEVLLSEAWERFKIPIAVTEVHLNCSREEQLRWFNEIYSACIRLNKKGADIKAVTAWSLLGSFGWDRLLTVADGEYEPGVYDLRAPAPRPTALASMIKSLAAGSNTVHPVSMEKGWWKREIRLLNHSSCDSLLPSHSIKNNSKILLIIGQSGTLGKAFARICNHRGIHYKLLSRKDTDITNSAQIENAINRYKPWGIINAAGYVRVDDAETECEKCFDANAKGPELLARACQQYGIKLMTFSSDQVFDGNKRQPYLESDEANPLNMYGKSKLKCEETVLGICESALIIRTSAFFSPWDQYNFVSQVLSALNLRQKFEAARDVYISPTYVPDLANVSLDLLIDDEKNIWHLSNRGEITWDDFAKEVSRRAGLDSSLISSQDLKEMNLKAPRPSYSVLQSEKGYLMPSLEHALNRYFNEQYIYESEFQQ